MQPDVWKLVTNREESGKSAVLNGYQRNALRGLLYPAIFRNDRDKVHGLVYERLDESDWQILDHFEGNHYERKLVEVVGPDGSVFPCFTYVALISLEDLRINQPWDFEKFTREHLSEFLRTYGGF